MAIDRLPARGPTASAAKLGAMDRGEGPPRSLADPCVCSAESGSQSSPFMASRDNALWCRSEQVRDRGRAADHGRNRVHKSYGLVV